MRISLRAALVSTAAALGLAATSVVPAQAASGFDRCPQGRFCVFDGAEGQGAMVSYTTPQSNLGSWRSRASSVINRTGYGEACLYSRTNYEVLDSVHDVLLSYSGNVGVNLSSYTDNNSHLDNNLGSVRWAHTLRECEGRAEPVDWSYTEVPDNGPAQAFGDLNRDGRPDLLHRSYVGRLWFLPGGSTGKLIGGGWKSMTALTRHGDLNGDGTEDLLARDTTGKLWMYPGNGRGSFGERRLIGGGWNSMSRLQSAGDLTGDGKGDLLARDTSGRLWLYPGNGRGSLGDRRLVGGGWNAMDAFAAPGDLNGDGRNDLVVSDTSGRLWLYPGNGRGNFNNRTMIGTGGWRSFTTLIGIGDLDRDGHPDLLATKNGDYTDVRVYHGLKGGRLTPGTLVGYVEDSDALF
ncbi:FG-GAP-like repeat-containing protein [Streptomyces melanogenes]|uniref:FG-GAP-like repeat-containing protein n=1 Tax=Streptomyces melanogenes TaxID=67326 RepID=UPI00167C9B49|nr:FG-GAP-like repeat-containing protein [Streptomyces melanogenes]GGP90489.1 ATP/GTP-binding protein [Streptomyces melanogenes]